MALRTWLGSVDTDVTNVNNYLETAGLANGHDLVISAAAVRDMANNVDQSAINLNSIIQEVGCPINVGQDATHPLKIGAATVSIRGSATGKATWLDTGATYSFGSVLVNPVDSQGNPIPAAAVQLAGAMTDVQIAAGAVVLKSGAITSLYTKAENIGSTPASNCTVTNAGATITKWWNLLANGFQTGGTTTLLASDTGVIDVMAGTLTGYELRGDAKILHRTNQTVTLALLLSSKCILDASLDSRTKTFTTVKLAPGAQFLRNNGLGNIAVTNLLTLIGQAVSVEAA